MIKSSFVYLCLLQLALGYEIQSAGVSAVPTGLQYLKSGKSSDAFKTLAQIANENGFRVESYQVTTKDGYILGIYRIPGKLGEPALQKGQKPPILLQHALICDMMVWVMNEPEVAPALFLARQGFDVWLGNNRGNRFSDRHTTLDPNSKEYWQFDWEEMGTMDQPAVIDFILKKTGFDKINYMGHSQGTTQLMAGASLMPEYYNSKINLAVLLAPPTAMYYAPNDGIRSSSWPFIMQGMLSFLDQIKFWNILPFEYKSHEAAEQICKLFDGYICKNMIGPASLDASVDNTDRIDMYMSNLPSGASAYSYVHYGQLVHLDKPQFLRYDHGKQGNMAKYGQEKPPAYDLKAIKFPIVIVSGSLDDEADPKDVAWLLTQLRPETVLGHREYKLAHQSFMVAKDMSFFTDYVFGFLKKYNNLTPVSMASNSLVNLNGLQNVQTTYLIQPYQVLLNLQDLQTQNILLIV